MLQSLASFEEATVSLMFFLAVALQSVALFKGYCKKRAIELHNTQL